MRKYRSLVGVVALVCLTTATSANADMSVQAFFSPGVPIDSTNNLPSQQKKMAWLDTGNLVGSAYETNPSAMTLPKVLKIGDIFRFRSSSFHGWLADPTSSTSPDIWGARMFCMVKITSTTANINPRRVRVRTWTSLTDNVLVSTNWLGTESISMSSTMPGRKYGEDGVRGGSDDAVFNSGTSDIELNELLAVGPRIFIDIVNQVDLESARNYWDSRKPIELFCEVLVFDTDMVTVIGKTEIVLSARPYLWIEGGIPQTQYIHIESERAKVYQLLTSSRPQGNWSDILGGLLQNGGSHSNNAQTNYLFFRAREAMEALRSSVSSKDTPISGVEIGNEVR